MLVVFSAPVATGKDSVIRGLLERFPTWTRNITTTSRPPRPGNIEGVDYYFVSAEEFEQKITAGDFIEYNVFSGNFYGTERARLEKLLDTYPVVITQADVHGKFNFDKANIPHLAIFLKPDSLETLKTRIKARGGLTEAQTADRLAIAEEELKLAPQYDYQIVNQEGKLAETIAEVTKIITDRLANHTPIDKKQQDG
jgi:guanylate kinase